MPGPLASTNPGPVCVPGRGSGEGFDTVPIRARRCGRHGTLPRPANDEVRQIGEPLARESCMSARSDFANQRPFRLRIHEVGERGAELIEQRLVLGARRDDALRLAPAQVDADVALEIGRQTVGTRSRPIDVGRVDALRELVAQLRRQLACEALPEILRQ